MKSRTHSTDAKSNAQRMLHDEKQDDRLAPAYFSPNCKYFDQLLQTVKNESTVLNLVFKGFFTNINSTIDFYTLCKRVSRFSVENFLSHNAEKFRRRTLLFQKKNLVTKNVTDKRGGGYHDFPSKLYSHSTEIFCRGTLVCFRKFRVLKNFMHRRGISRFSVENSSPHSTKKFRRGTLPGFRKFLASKNVEDKREREGAS